jgi:uncharacterized membrane protein YfcA
MFRPLVTLVIAAVTVIQLIDRPPRLPELTWTLTAVAIAAAVASAFVIDRLPARAQVALAAVFVLSSAPLLALAPSSRPDRPEAGWRRGRPRSRSPRRVRWSRWPRRGWRRPRGTRTCRRGG